MIKKKILSTPATGGNEGKPREYTVKISSYGICVCVCVDR